MRLLALIGLLAIVAAAAGGVYFLGGYYSVAASAEEAGPVGWLLRKTREASISRRADIKPPAALDDAAVQSGAKAYALRGCPTCHGGPGAQWAKFSEGLNPDPPDLKEQAKNLSAGTIFWVVKNGIRMTGMPSFEKAGVPDQEIWHIAAFVKKLPSVSEADYKAWTAASPASPAPAAAPPQ